MASLKYGSFKLYSQESLGVGAYGKVCKATYGQLPCAAKLLHDTLFSSNDPGVNSVVRKFEQECQFLSTIKHPNIVQYLGTTRDPQSGRLVLLMELMDESLTSFLDRSSSPLPYHTQLNICFDVALALAYLHFNDIIHRDLSSNNVLMIGDGGRAKVTDLGMSRLIDMNPRMTPMTQVPGTAAYMPPEALITPPHYSKKLDCFSHGVLCIQTVTRCFPNPGDAHMKVSSATFRGFAQIPEAERRKKDIVQIESDHPLLPIALASIKDNDKQRPSADDLCMRLSALRKEPSYASSMKQTRQHFEKLRSELEELRGKEQQHKMELEEKNQAINRLEAKLKVQNTNNTESLRKLSVQSEGDNPFVHVSAASVGDGAVNPYLTLGSPIQIPVSSPGNTLRYGTIKWIGLIPNATGEVAGIELDEVMDGCSDGTFPHTTQKFFHCPPGKGLYYPLRSVQPDQRYQATTDDNPLKDVSDEEETASSYHFVDQYIGDKKGIQGHQDSCYLDATLFGLFALTNEFDYMFLHSATEFQTIGYILWKNIVNPLRKNGVVKFECVMKLKEQLDKLGKMKGITQDEKDPEEFLNMMFKHALHVEPFISIRRPFGVEKEYFVQLFLEMDDSQKLPTVGDLLNKMFSEQKISFTEVPMKLLIQMPQFGKKFQTFQKVIPAKSINVADNVDLHTRLDCQICGDSAFLVCQECKQDFPHVDDIPAFCSKCVKTIHQHKSRQGHKYEYSAEMQNLLTMAEFELLSVICIETSHYVCFTRQENKWIFFDSMASRVYDKYNIPKVVECTKLLDEWVYPEGGNMTRLLNTPPRELPEYVRRFTQDIYMCVYIQPDLSMYG